jgi:ABC-type transport system substrate-binding protein
MPIPTLNRRELIGGAAGLSAVALIAAHRAGAQSTPVEASGPPADAADNQEFRQPAITAQVRLDPHFGYSVYQVGTFVYQMWSGLTRMDASLGIVGDIATKWDLSADGKTYTFHLDPDRKFSDGSPITAQDVVWSWTRSLNPATQSLVAGGYLQDVVGAQDYWLGKTPDPPTSYKAIDDHTFQVELIAPKNYFPDVLVHPCTFVVKQSDVEAGTADSPWANKAKAFGGPYMISSYEEGQTLVLAPNPNYPIKQTIQKMTYRLVDDTQTQLLLYQNDEVDFTPIAEADADNIKNNDQTHLPEMITVPQWWSNNLYLRNGLKPFDDENVRRAFAMAVNKDAILTAVLKGLQTDIEGIYYPGMSVYNPDLKGTTYDSAGAKAALAASSYGSADKLPPISFWSTEEDQGTTLGRIVSALQEMWRQELGVDVTTRIVPTYEEMLKSDIQIVIGGEALHYPDASGVGYFLCNSGSNISQMCDNAIDAKYQQAGATQDPAESKKLYQEIETDLIGRVALYPIYQQTNYFLAKPRVKNLKTTAMYTFPDFDKVYIAKT